MSTPSTPSMSSIITQEAALVQENFAPIFAASFVGMIFFGIVINQTYHYYTRYSRDVIWVKIFVAWVVLLDVLSTIFTIWWMYFLFISNWGNIEVFNVGNWLISTDKDSQKFIIRGIDQYNLHLTDPVLLGLMACSTHVFFARRIYLMTKNIYIAALIVCLGLMTMGGALSVSIKFLQIPNFASLNKLKAAVILWLLPSTLGDIVITVSISWHLRYKKSGFKRTDRIVDKLIRGEFTIAAVIGIEATQLV
ncbi:hypothetical protein AcV5_001953 [Taiwanofungus camphoratus]|nr:hypothetical protein AcV5_001953 [Antrodia cinnamomea]